MDDDMIYYAKSPNPQGYQQTVKEHLLAVAELAQKFGTPMGLATAAELAGQTHDFGKYSQAFQEVLSGTRIGIDHAMGGACYLEAVYRGSVGARPVIEAVNGHHNGLVAYDEIRSELHAVADPRKRPCGNGGKTPAIEDKEQLQAANAAFRKDFPSFKPPMLSAPPIAELESMLYTRMLFSCLVDADYTASALNDDSTYLDRAENNSFDPQALLKKLTEYRDGIRQSSTADRSLNTYRDRVFEQCGKMGNEPEGLYTLTAPTGTGKTLALLHFALRHCLKHGKQRIIMVLPFLTLAEQSAEVYSKIIPDVLIDHSQSDLPEDAWELAARWSAPVIITTSVRFFESLFSDQPAACRKLHNIADSVIIFDEAQTLPGDYLAPCVSAIAQLIQHYHSTAVLCTATQPALEPLFRRFAPELHPQEITPDAARLYEVLRRTTLQDLGTLPQEEFAARLANHPQVLCVVNRRKTAQQLYAALPAEGSYCLTTLLCAADRRRQLDAIRQRLKEGLPCRVVSTSLIEAGVDVDFPVAYREQCGLDSLLQTAGRCNREGRRGAEESIVYRFRLDECSTPQMLRQNVSALDYTARHQDTLDTPRAIQLYFNELSDLRGPDAVDKHGILDAFLRGIRGCQFPFAQVAEEFRLIENAARTVYLPVGEGAALCEQLRSGHVTRTLLRKLGVYSVSCYKDQFDKLDAAGALELRPDGSAILTDTSCYSEKTGLAMDVETGIGLYF
mgnify:CR=1 FL=1